MQKIERCAYKQTDSMPAACVSVLRQAGRHIRWKVACSDIENHFVKRIHCSLQHHSPQLYTLISLHFDDD